MITTGMLSFGVMALDAGVSEFRFMEVSHEIKNGKAKVKISKARMKQR